MNISDDGLRVYELALLGDACMSTFNGSAEHCPLRPGPVSGGEQ